MYATYSRPCSSWELAAHNSHQVIEVHPTIVGLEYFIVNCPALASHTSFCSVPIRPYSAFFLDGGHGIEDNEMKKIVKLVSKEIEAGDSDFLTYTEFEHMIATAPDFVRFFRIPVV